ncbi:MAG: hypothetical protein ACT4QA_23415 [Panacagrimonas sp.]
MNRDEYGIFTPVATIGVRGTDHEPYVLLDEAATGTPDKPGSYDKVNRGTTVLQNEVGELQVDTGRVGFAGAKVRKRGLMTLLLPVLLERVPGFYLGGQFEKELDEYSQSADQLVGQKLELARAACDQGKAVAECPAPEKVAKDWISSFDAAVERRDAKGVLELFADDVSILAKVQDANGALVETTLTRQQLADSAVAAVQKLENYSQQRQTLEARALPVESGGACGHVEVKSFVVERGKLTGKPYRFEAQEEYTLVMRAGRWLAVRASATPN